MHETLGIAVCDDDKFYLDKIQSIISGILSQRRISFFLDTYQSGEAFMQEMASLQKYDLIFLDIEMQGTNGVEIARKIRKNNFEMAIVFVTVMMGEMCKGYSVGAFRYILKDEITEGIHECLEAFFYKEENKERMMEFPCVGGTRKIRLKYIIYLESQNHKVYIYLKNKEVLEIYERLDVLEKLIDSEEYVRVHKSYLVNMGYIHKIHGYQVHLREEMTIPVAKSRYGDVKEQYLRFKEKM